MFNPKKLSKMFAYITLFFTLFLIFSTNVNADFTESPSANYVSQTYNRGTGYFYQPDEDVNLTFFNRSNIENPNGNNIAIYNNGTTLYFHSNIWNGDIMKVGIILNSSIVYAFMIYSNGCVNRPNAHDSGLTYPINVNKGVILGGVLSNSTCGNPEIYVGGDGYSLLSWNVTPVFVPKNINITFFKAENITNSSIVYSWEWLGDFTWNELYLNDILYYNSTNGLIKNFIASNLEDGKVYIAKYFVFYNSTLFDFETITNTTIKDKLTQTQAIQNISKGFNLFVFLIIYVIALFVPLIAKILYKEKADIITLSSFLIMVILLFYIHTIETGITNLFKWVVSIVIFGSMFVLNEEILDSE